MRFLIPIAFLLLTASSANCQTPKAPSHTRVAVIGETNSTREHIDQIMSLAAQHPKEVAFRTISEMNVDRGLGECTVRYDRKKKELSIFEDYTYGTGPPEEQTRTVFNDVYRGVTDSKLLKILSKTPSGDSDGSFLQDLERMLKNLGCKKVK